MLNDLLISLAFSLDSVIILNAIAAVVPLRKLFRVEFGCYAETIKNKSKN
jgi:hypothetical protein